MGRIQTAEVALVIWKRQPPTGVPEWLDALPSDHLPKGRFVGPAACVSARLTTLCDLVGLDDCPQRRSLVGDVSRLARSFAAVIGSRDLDLRLEVVDHDSCWRFHRDHVGYRLNATYRGPGTQWLPSQYADRALKAQRRFGGPRHEMPRFAAGLFKGVVRAGSEAIVHRSPPVAGSSQTRLFLCLNEVDDNA
ncbi:MAG: DUF1826 domain-containing protein [Acidimicrobiia bacterium]